MTVSRFWICFLPWGTRGYGIVGDLSISSISRVSGGHLKDYLVGHLLSRSLEFTDVLFCLENRSSFRHLKVVNLGEGRNCKLQHIDIK